jgi:hypothetical protein
MSRSRHSGGPRFPGGARFAFTILDDTDDSTLENIRPVYDRLQELGFRTTKTVWPLECPEGSRHFYAADTLERSEYLEWVRELVAAGFDLGLHGATMESSLRERTQSGLERIKRNFGGIPRVYANHGFNRENLYWGAQRFRTPWLRYLVARLSDQDEDFFQGQMQGSEYFWGDLCQRHVEYVRGLTSGCLNIERFDPHTPYRLNDTPFVNFWFSTADAPDAETFKRRMTIAALDKLEAEGGICILSTHLGKGYARDGRLDPDIDKIFRGLAERSGWFVPVAEILDFMRDKRASDRVLSAAECARLELRFCRLKLLERFESASTKRRRIRLEQD